MLQDYLTLSQAIRKYEGISLGHLARLVRAGEIQGERAGNQWLVKEASLRAWLAQKGKLQEAQEGEAEQSDQGEPERAEAGAHAS